MAAGFLGNRIQRRGNGMLGAPAKGYEGIRVSLLGGGGLLGDDKPPPLEPVGFCTEPCECRVTDITTRRPVDKPCSIGPIPGTRNFTPTTYHYSCETRPGCVADCFNFDELVYEPNGPCVPELNLFDAAWHVATGLTP